MPRQGDALDPVLQEALTAVSAGLDLDEAGRAIRDCLRAVSRQAAELAGRDYGEQGITLRCPDCGEKHAYRVPSSPLDVARAMGSTGKVLDEVVRLAAFAKGQPDSRPERAQDVLGGLTDEQLRIVHGWLTANAAATGR